MIDLTIVILAGGKSSRMGSDKGLLHVNEKPMVKHVLDVTSQFDFETIIIANNTEYENFGVPVYKDIYKELGPLGGIHSAFENTKTDYILVLSCDTPFVTKELLSKIIESVNHYDIIIPKHSSKTHPLIGIYSRITLNILVQSLEDKELKVMNFIDKFNSNIIDITQLVASDKLENINSQEDLFASVKLKVFGMIAERLNFSEILISIPNKEQINLKTYFESKWPFLTEMSYTISIDQILRDKLNKNERPTEIAILPPFAGG